MIKNKKMRKYLSFTLLFLPLIVTAQKYFLSASILNSQPVLVNDKFTSTKLTHYYKNNQGYSFGAGVELSGKRYFSTRLSIEYSAQQYKEIIDGWVFGTDIDPNMGIISYSKEIRFRKSGIIQFPVEIIKYWGQTKRFYVGIGLSPDFLIYKKMTGYMLLGNGTIEYYLPEDRTNERLRLDNVTVNLCVGYTIPIKNIMLQLEPYAGIRTIQSETDNFGSKGNIANYGFKTLLSIQSNKVNGASKCYRF
jgi:hypothetical protein